MARLTLSWSINFYRRNFDLIFKFSKKFEQNYGEVQ